MGRVAHPSRGVLPSVVCPTECDREASIMRKSKLTRAVELLKEDIFVKLYYWNHTGERGPQILSSRAPRWPTLL
jgi:hypothetical protein